MANDSSEKFMDDVDANRIVHYVSTYEQLFLAIATKFYQGSNVLRIVDDVVAAARPELRNDTTLG